MDLLWSAFSTMTGEPVPDVNFRISILGGSVPRGEAFLIEWDQVGRELLAVLEREGRL